MPISDDVLFKTIFEKYSDRPIDEVMTLVAQAKAAYNQAEKLESACISETGDGGSCECMSAETVSDESMAPEIKRPTRRNLKFNPSEAIQDDKIICCLCCQSFTTLTSRHLKKHGTDPEHYRKLCGYSEKQFLMSNKRAAQMQETIKKAQAGRKHIQQNNTETPAPSADPNSNTNVNSGLTFA